MEKVAGKPTSTILTFPMIISAILIIGVLVYLGLSYKNGFSLLTKVTQGEQTPTPTQTEVLPTVVATVTLLPDQNTATSDPAVMQFTSQELGITFNYMKATTAIKRVGNKVYIAPTSMKAEEGQYVEVFTKEQTQSLTAALESNFLQGFVAANCFVSNSAKTFKYPSGYEAKVIATPPFDDIEQMEKKVALCPKTYTQSNGIAYFLASSIRLDKFVYISVGQYQINGTSVDNGWQDTLRFLVN